MLPWLQDVLGQNFVLCELSILVMKFLQHD